MNTLSMKKGFTLIELLIVIAIIAILATAVVLLLNPAVLLAQARDSQRISDLDTMKSAIALWQSTTGSSLGGSAVACYYFNPATPITPGANCDGRHAGRTSTANTSTAVNGTGWVFGLDFSTTPGGSPLPVLPRDPKPDNTHFYSYTTDTAGQFEIDANMESGRYGQGGTDDAESTDGGPVGQNNVREVGNAINLAF